MLFALLSACKPQTGAPAQPPAETAANSEEAFISAAKMAMQAVSNNDSLRINELIHPDYGVFLIDNPGAFTIASHYDRYESLSPIHKVILREHEISNCVLTKAPLPEYSCEDEGWTRLGCFWDDISNYQGITKKCANFLPEFWQQPPAEEELKAAQRIEKLPLRGVCSTDDGGFTFYMARIEGKWYIVVLDFVEPCSA